jgi:hypothetical protein
VEVFIGTIFDTQFVSHSPRNISSIHEAGKVYSTFGIDKAVVVNLFFTLWTGLQVVIHRFMLVQLWCRYGGTAWKIYTQ